MENTPINKTGSLVESDENRVRDVEKYFRPACNSVLNNRLDGFSVFSTIL